jgi:hypothetical protein
VSPYHWLLIGVVVLMLYVASAIAEQVGKD